MKSRSVMLTTFCSGKAHLLVSGALCCKFFVLVTRESCSHSQNQRIQCRGNDGKNDVRASPNISLCAASSRTIRRGLRPCGLSQLLQTIVVGSIMFGVCCLGIVGHGLVSDIAAGKVWLRRQVGGAFGSNTSLNSAPRISCATPDLRFAAAS